MNFARAVSLFFVATMLVASVALAQAPRTDAIWAKRAQKPIVLNGVLSEHAWAVNRNPFNTHRLHARRKRSWSGDRC